MEEEVELWGYEDDAADDPEIISVHMDIQLPIQTLKGLLRDQTGIDLRFYDVWLKNVQFLEDERTLVDQCVQGEGLVQVDAQIFEAEKLIKIVDVVQPTEEVYNAIESVEESTGVDANIVMSEKDQGNSSGSADSK